MNPDHYDPEALNFGLVFPDTVDTPAHMIKAGDWVLYDNSYGRNFLEVSHVESWGPDGVAIYHGEVGAGTKRDTPLPVALDPDEAREWQAHQVNDGRML